MRGLRCLLHQFWSDEIGVILSAEAALLGTVAVIGTTVGLSALSKSVNDELTEVASAFRSLDQSYHFEGQCRCGAWTAGSSYQQRPVEESLEELCTFVEEQQHHSEHGRQHEADDEDDVRDDRSRDRHESADDDDADDRRDRRRESDDDDDDRPRGRVDDDRDDDDRPRSRERDDDDEDQDELSLEIDTSADEFSEPVRVRPAAGE